MKKNDYDISLQVVFLQLSDGRLLIFLITSKRVYIVITTLNTLYKLNNRKT